MKIFFVLHHIIVQISCAPFLTILCMMVEILILTFILISTSYCYNYFIRFKSHDAPCILLSVDVLWVRCIINQSEPLKFFSKTSLSNVNLDFTFNTIGSLILPSEFFIDDNNENFSVSSSMKNHPNLIYIDATQTFQLKQINMSTYTFLNLNVTSIHFMLHNCGYPVIHFERNTLYSNNIENLFVSYHNRSRTVLLKDYFSSECLNDEDIIFINEKPNRLTKFNILTKRKHVNSVKLVVNGCIFTIAIILISILMCLISRKTAKLKVLDIFYDGKSIDKEERISLTSQSPTSNTSCTP